MSKRLVALLGALVLFAGACGSAETSGAATPEPAVSVAEPTPSSTSPPTTAAVATTSAPTTAAPTTTTTAAPELPSRPYAVLQSTATYVDTTRITPAGAQTEELPARTLDVWIDRPDTPEPRPLVIFAHGLTGHPRSHELLRTQLAAEGFVVVAPAFPLTNNDVPGGFANAGDTAEQVNDVTFIIDSVLADPELGALVDAARIGMIGHSLGGITTAGAALSPSGDRRISAAVVISAGYGKARDDVAVMTVHGDADRVVPYASSVLSYELLTGRRVFVTLLGGSHITGILDDDSDLGVALRGLAAAFFAVELGVDDGQSAAIVDLPLDVVTVEAGTAEGPLVDWRDYFSG
jgi:dienelactone hydrolase